MYQHPSQLRVANVRRAFRLLLAGGPCSRAELARQSGLSPVTAGKLVDGMLAEGLVEEVDAAVDSSPAASVMGRPPQLVGLSRRWRLPVVEIGVRSTSVRCVSLGQAPSADVDAPPAGATFRTPSSARAFLAAARRAKASLRIGRSSAVLVSVPGVLDAEGSEILFSPNLRWTKGRHLLDGIGRLFGARVCAVQEIQALALGQLATGRGPESFVLVDFADGVGGAVVAGGQLLHGPQPLCGEIGHTGVYGNRRRCGCGSVGCLETLASRGGILASFRTARRNPKATWEACARHVAGHGLEPWLASTIDAAATTVAGALNLLGSSEIVLSGEFLGWHPDLLGAFSRRVQEHALIGRFGRLRCQLAPRRRLLGLVAAAADRVLLPEPARVVSSAEREAAATA